MIHVRNNLRIDEVRRKAREATRLAGNDVMADASNEAKGNHPGWKNITGTAEGSVRVLQPMHDEGPRLVGRWGSSGVGYVIWLELKHGSFLRSAAGATYPSFAHRAAEHFGRLGGVI